MCTRQLCNYRDHLSSFDELGVQLLAVNDDPVLHNVHALTLNNEITVALPKKGDRQERTFSGADVDGSFKCDLHPWEKGRLYVFSHPFFTVTESSGGFSIKRPDGKRDEAAARRRRRRRKL